MAQHLILKPVLMIMAVIFILEFGRRLPCAEGGYEGYQCPEGPNVRSPCSMDCKINHNALYGHCGEGNDFNCYCSRPLTSRVSRGIQCLDKFNAKYDMVCRVDCLCNHAALDSQCNYETRTCECLGQNPNPGVNNCTLCPFQRQVDMQQYVIDMRLPFFPKSVHDSVYPPGFKL